MAVRLEMRVDMRRWALVLCFIGVMGGGCSARSLLTIELSTDDGTAVQGTPLIEVRTPSGGHVKTVEDDTVIMLAEGSSSTVGVYLDGDVSGTVEVMATLRASGNCRWSGGATGSVHSGQRTQVEIKLSRKGCAGTLPDAGTDAGDAGDAPKDDGPTLLGDAGDGTTSAPPLEECRDYCRTYVTRCADWGASAFSEQSCMVRCLSWPRGAAYVGDARENTLACHQYYLRKTAADTDARALCSMCPLASPDSEACGGITPSPPREACYGDASADGD